MSDLTTRIVVCGSLYKIAVYKTDGTLVVQYDSPVGSTEGATSDNVLSGTADFSGDIWLLVIDGTDSKLRLKRLVTDTGALVTNIDLSGQYSTGLTGGYVCRYGLDQLLVNAYTGAVYAVSRYTTAGVFMQTYAVPTTARDISLAGDNKTLYYRINGAEGSTPIHRWDLSTDTALADWGNPGAHFGGRFQVLPDLGILANWTVAAQVRNYAPDGTLRWTYEPTGSSALVAFDTGCGVNYDLATQAVYGSTGTSNMSFGGTLERYSYTQGGLFQWFKNTYSGRANVNGIVIVTPPFGSPQNYTPTSTTTETIRRVRRCPHLSHEQIRTVFDRFQLDFQAGGALSDGQTVAECQLSWSDDGGHTWSAPRLMSLGSEGQYGYRAQDFMLGQSRDRIFQLAMTSAVPVAWLNAYLDFRPGTS